MHTLPVVEDVIGDEDLAALMDARYRPAEHVGWPCTLAGREHGLPVWTLEHTGWNAPLRAAFALLLPLQCAGRAAPRRVTQVKERFGRLVIHAGTCGSRLTGVYRMDMVETVRHAAPAARASGVSTVHNPPGCR